ncbi:MAG: O-antigen ligase family protein [Candidatus Woesebacteria bacterium]|nr:O-antigen ligase family protein [Candidatus Woesebacteria bacterium]
MMPVLFNILFLILPLVFFKNTSELFEFNKVIVLYLFTSLIVSGWLIESIKQRKFIFRPTKLDVPLVIYLSIYLISTLFSIDPRTSWLGYYSRFNGGLVTQICYALLYWAFVSNLNQKQAQKVISYMLYAVGIAALLAIGERFGIFATCGMMNFGLKESCWVQDVQARVFSTLGQPNWLAALLVALIPISWVYAMKHKAYGILSILFFVTLLFTKSRSGLLAFAVSAIIFWGFMLKRHVKEFLILNIIFLILFFVFNKPSPYPLVPAQGNSLETGGTESGTIRKYVWLGALSVFKHYPILGTGPETFAFSYPMFKPVGHNLTSEWDFIYNKAHNEFLNYLANTGILGFISYLSLITFSIIIISKSGKYEYLAGFIAILVTNFFGFSVVPVSLLFFLLPAIALVSSSDYKIHLDKTKLKLFERLMIYLVLIINIYFLFIIYYYWKADIYYNSSQFEKALSISPNEPNYISKLALTDTKVETASKALKLSPYNQNVRKILISNLVKNADTDPNNLKLAETVINNGIKLSPNDPKLYYQLGILQLKIAKNNEAVANLEKAVELKTNYKEGRYALGMTYKSLNMPEEAKQEFEYILKNIDPDDELTKKNLDDIIH